MKKQKMKRTRQQMNRKTRMALTTKCMPMRLLHPVTLCPRQWRVHLQIRALIKKVFRLRRALLTGLLKRQTRQLRRKSPGKMSWTQTSRQKVQPLWKQRRLATSLCLCLCLKTALRVKARTLLAPPMKMNNRARKY
jgi:hypothetical protein